MSDRQGSSFLKDKLLESSKQKKHSNSDSSLSQDSRGGSNNLDFGSPMIGGPKKKSTKRSVAGEEMKVELQDFSAKDSGINFQGFKKYQDKNKAKIAEESKEIKSSSSFNRSDDEDNKYYDLDDDNEVVVRDKSIKETVLPMPANRITSNFGAIRQSNQDGRKSTEMFANTYPNRLEKSVSIIREGVVGEKNPVLTTSITRTLREQALKQGIYSSIESKTGRFAPGLLIAQNNLQEVPPVEDPAKKAQKIQLFHSSVLKFNYYENILIFLLMLNSIISSNYINSFYFLFAIVLTWISMTRNVSTIKVKFSLSITMIVISVLVLAAKCALVFLMLKDRKIPEFKANDILFYKNVGIIILQKENKVNNFNTLFFDSMECFLSIMITIIYKKHLNDVKLPFGVTENSSKLLNILFGPHSDRLCQLALFALLVETVFIQTIIQVFILLLIIIVAGHWAFNYIDEHQHLRYLILTFSQVLLLIQLIVTFVLQIPEIQQQVFLTDFAMILDLFGVLLHNLHLYQILLHLLSICFAVQIIQLFKCARYIGIEQGKPIIEEAIIEDNTSRLGGYNNITFKRTMVYKFDKTGGKNIGGRGRPSFIEKKGMRGKSPDARQDETYLHQTSEKVQTLYAKYSQQIQLWFSRIAIFIWAYAYHDYQSLFMLLWIMHSTLVKGTERFIYISVNFYFPIFVGILLFYYIINIPRVVEFEKFGDEDKYNKYLDRWRTYGFYQFSIPPLEISLMILALAPFLLLTKGVKVDIKEKENKKNDKDEAKVSFLESLTNSDARIFKLILFTVIKNLDIVAFITIFFSGVNKIDFYHVFLIFFFVAYILNKEKFMANYIILLIYVDFFVFEKYLYTLIIHYIPPDSLFIKIAQVLGLATDYSEVSDRKYFKYPPKFQQWILIFVVFLQFKINQILKDREQIKIYTDNATKNCKTNYSRLYHIWEIYKHLKKEFLILFSFIIFFMIIILTTKSIINWGFQIILCIFIITYVGVGNQKKLIESRSSQKDSAKKGYTSGHKRLAKVWFLIIWYSSLVLILQITYQFCVLPIVRQALQIDYFLDMLPTWIRKNIGIIGFSIYSKYIWEKFLIYLIYFAVGVYVNNAIKPKKEDIKGSQKIVDPNNSDMDQLYDNQAPINDFDKEYQKIRFTTPYLVYKLKPLWIVLDQLSQSLFVVTSVMIMILSNYWQISLSMAIHLTCFISLCLMIASALYTNRKHDKKILNVKKHGDKKADEQDKKKDDQKKDGRAHKTGMEISTHWTSYKKKVNEMQIKLRARVWLFQFIFTLLCMVVIYPTEFVHQIRDTFIEEKQDNIVNILEHTIFYMFWAGVYHSPFSIDHHGYFYNFYGYLIILILLIFEKNGQMWSLDRFGCTEQLQAHYKEIEDNIAKEKEVYNRQNALSPVQIEVIEEEKEENDSNSDKRSDYEAHNVKPSNLIVSSHLDQSINHKKDNPLTKEELLALLKKWVMKKYRIKLLNGIKILLEDTIQLMLLISSVYKDSVIGLILLLGVFLFMTRRKIKQMQRLAWIVGFCMILQYGLALSNLTSDNNPMDFPSPFDPYPKNDKDVGRFFIPWYRKIPLLMNNFNWAMYLGMGISNTKLNGLWIDFFIMGLIQVHLYYFCCQLFNVDLKIVKDEQFRLYLQQYCQKCHKNQFLKPNSDQERKKINKIKNNVMLHNVYKYLQTVTFMKFHQVTIVVTLLLAVLARSMFSFGYIIVCLIMIYENHKFFRVDQENFKLQSVLRYWLQPYVYFDITLQLMYQIPLQVLHRDQNLGIKWCWQNIIGFQDIWIKDENNVDEMVVRSIMFIILKTFTFYFVTLQIQIFNSAAYKRYVKKDLKNYIDMSNTKGMAIIWRHNNMKIQKIKEQETENQNMNSMLNDLKNILKNWQQKYNLDAPADNSSGSVVAGGDVSAAKPELGQSAVISNPTSSIKQSFKEEKKQQTTHDLIDQLGRTDDQNLKSKKLRVHNIAMTQDLQISPTKHFKTMTATDDVFSAHTSSEQVIVYQLDDEMLLEQAKKKLGFLAKTLIYCKKNLTDQIIFISSRNYLRKVANDMQAGNTNIYTKFERKMLSDIRDYRENQIDDKITEIDLKDMPRTQEMLKLGKMIQMYGQLVVEMLSTYSDYVCYLFMIISMMKNAGLISLVYPFAVFGYSLLEEINPRKKIWYGILIYTEVLIFIKFLYQLSFWEAIFWDYQLQHFQDILNAIHVGLFRKASGQFGEMLAYFIPEIFILFSIMSHIQKEIMIGLLSIKEEHVESIKEALARYIKYNKALEQLVKQQSTESPHEKKFTTQLVDNDLMLNLYNTNKEDGVFNFDFSSDIQRYELKTHQVVNLREYKMIVHNMQDEEWLNTPANANAAEHVRRFRRKNSFFEEEAKIVFLDFSEDVEAFIRLDFDEVSNPNKKHHDNLVIQETTSMFDTNEELQEFYKRKLLLNDQQQKDNMNIVHKAGFSMKYLLYQNPYFERLFPSIKEQKPGKDLYAIIATFQFLICLFLIFFYTKMDADVTITSDSLTYNQFSGQMVIALFIQILIMIIDRYNYKSKTFISIQEKQEQKKLIQEQLIKMQNIPNVAEDRRSTVKAQEIDNKLARGQSFVDFMQGKNAIDNTPFRDQLMESSVPDLDPLLKQQQEKANLERLEKLIELDQTIITLSIVSKFYLQWILLILVHLLVFWFFPIHGNIKLQNNANCVGGGVCNEFGGNPALIIFYLLYCCYFWVSALQIRYGVPEMKKGNFMMNDYTRLNKFALQGFMAIPFLFELKTFVDWTFTRTALDVFQWFILSATHSELFIAKCVQGRYQRKPLGRQIRWFDKVGLGGFGQLFIVLLIAGPLLLFSNFNPISTPNPVTNSLIKLNIIVEPKDSLAKNTINLFTNNYVTQLTKITQFQYEKMQFANDARTKSYDQSLVQYIKMNNYADANWAASLPNRLQLKKEFENHNSTTSLSISLAYTFDRANPNAPSASNEVVQPLKASGMDNVFRGFSKIFSLDCETNKSANSTLFIPPFFTGVHYLNDKDFAQNDTNRNRKWVKGLRVFYSCENYWKVDQYFNCSIDSKDESVCPEGRIPGQNLTGVSFYTFSTKIAPSYFKYSIITFYVSIVLVIGKLFRNVCIIPANRIFIWEIPDSCKLLLLCECIYIYRMRSQLEQEEQLYFTFADIMRSPEMIKAITGSSMKKKAQ